VTTLESRYRRLLALLPWEYRRRYEEEMLGVLLDGAAEGQRRPRAAETADLVATAVRLRLRGTGRRLDDREWAAAAAAVGALTAIAMVAIGVRRIGMVLGVAYTYGQVDPTVGRGDVVRLTVWALVATAALIGWRRAAAVLALGGAAIEVVIFGYVYGGDSLRAAQPAVVALVAAAGLTAAVLRFSTFRLGRGPVLWALAAGAAAVLASLLEVTYRPDGTDVFVLGRALTAWSAAGWAVALVLAGAAVVALAPPVRRRTAALLAAPLTLPAVASVDPYSIAYGGLAYQAVALVVVPAAALAVGVALVHRREERMRLVDLGRAADLARRGS